MLPSTPKVNLIHWFPGELSFVPITITRKNKS